MNSSLFVSSILVLVFLTLFTLVVLATLLSGLFTCHVFSNASDQKL